MLLALTMASTSGFTCRLFAIRRAVGMCTVPLAFKDHGSAAVATLAIIESPPVMAAMAAALSAVATAMVSAVAAKAVALAMAVAVSLGLKLSKLSFFLV